MGCWGKYVKLHLMKSLQVQVDSNNKSQLFFDIDGDIGASFFPDYKSEQFSDAGFKLLSPRRGSSEWLKSLLYSPEKTEDMLYDCCFRIGENHTDLVKAHKCILVARSQYFKCLLTKMESPNGMIELHEIDITVFREVIGFMYTGNLNLNSKNLCEILTAAYRFQIPDLVIYCRELFRNAVTKDNVISVFIAANNYEDDALKERAKQYILEHFDQLKNNNSFKSLLLLENQNLLLELISCLTVPKKDV